MLTTVCPTPGCPAITDGGPCPKHAHAQRAARERGRPSRYERGYGTEWRRTRARYLRTHPWCVFCAGHGRFVKATDVHHVDGQGPKGPHGHDPNNFLALCHPCHSRATNAK